MDVAEENFLGEGGREGGREEGREGGREGEFLSKSKGGIDEKRLEAAEEGIWDFALKGDSQ